MKKGEDENEFNKLSTSGNDNPPGFTPPENYVAPDNSKQTGKEVNDADNVKVNKGTSSIKKKTTSTTNTIFALTLVGGGSLVIGSTVIPNITKTVQAPVIDENETTYSFDKDSLNYSIVLTNKDKLTTVLSFFDTSTKGEEYLETKDLTAGGTIKGTFSDLAYDTSYTMSVYYINNSVQKVIYTQNLTSPSYTPVTEFYGFDVSQSKTTLTIKLNYIDDLNKYRKFFFSLTPMEGENANYHILNEAYISKPKENNSFELEVYVHSICTAEISVLYNSSEENPDSPLTKIRNSKSGDRIPFGDSTTPTDENPVKLYSKAIYVN